MKGDTLMTTNEYFAANPVIIERSYDRHGFARSLAKLIWLRPVTALQDYLELWNWDTCDP